MSNFTFESQDTFPGDYLEAKQLLDQRSRSREVEEWFHRELESMALVKGPLRLVEMGAGTLGYPRYAQVPWQHLKEYLAYEPEETLRKRSQTSDLPGAGKISLVAGGTETFLLSSGSPADVFTAHAFLDLMDPRRFLPQIFNKMSPGGLFYFTLVFDGMSCFLPEDPDDRPMIQAYHKSMVSHNGQRDGAMTGRRTLDLLSQKKLRWIARPTAWQLLPKDSLPGRDVFLAQMLRYFQGALEKEKPEAWEDWLQRRLYQLKSGQLGFLASYWDIAGVLQE
jgi:hypothetical protein